MKLVNTPSSVGGHLRKEEMKHQSQGEKQQKRAEVMGWEKENTEDRGN